MTKRRTEGAAFLEQEIGDEADLPIRRVSTDELKLDERNARKHGRKNLRAIKASLIEFGQVQALVVEKGTGRVIGGNGTLRALRALAKAQPSVQKWKRAMIVEVDEHDKRATALAVALNRTSELAEWDDDALAALLREQIGEIDLDKFGWEDSELTKLLASSKTMEIPGDEDDDDHDDVGEDDVQGDGMHYRIIIECASEGEQADLLARLESEGLTVQPLIS